MKYMEYVAQITETVISLEVQLKLRFLLSHIHSSATVSFFMELVQVHLALSLHRTFSLGQVYPRVLIIPFSFICQNGQFSHSGSHIMVGVV